MRRICLLLSLSLLACDPSPAEDDAGGAQDAGAPADAGPGDAGLIAVDGGVPPAPTMAFFDQCAPGEAPDADCYAMRRDPSSAQVALATAIAERWMGEHPADTLRWDWVDAILVYSFMELWRVTGDAALLDYAQSWLERHVEAGYEIEWSDHCPPMLAAQTLWLERRDPAFLRIVEDVLSYYRVVPRTEAGGVGHLGHLGRTNPTQWLDSLMMVAVPLALWGERTNAPAWIEEAAGQALIFAETMQDDSGWLVHASSGTQTPDTFWARGNGWVMLAWHEILRVYRVRGESNPELEAVTEQLTDAILAAQDPDTGLFWTVVNRPGDTYLETSSTALFAYGLARGLRYGYRDDGVRDAIAAAMAGIMTQIADGPDGPVVSGISGPTSVGTYDYYAGVEVEDDLPYGLGAVILALVETSGL